MTAGVARHSAELEQKNIPTVSGLSPIMEETFCQVSMQNLMPSLRYFVDPDYGVPATVPLAATTVSDIITSLTSPLTDSEKAMGTITPTRPSRTAMKGTYDMVQDSYEGAARYTSYDLHISKWTDGLPIVPPTEQRVAQFLSHTSHKPDEVIGIMPPQKWEFNVEKVAINGVMAGCKPEHMPVLLALAEACTLSAGIATAARSNTAFGFMAVVSGPIAKEISMNWYQNIINPGNPANATIGRALSLFRINLGGAASQVTLTATTGNPANYSCCFAEDFESNPWPSLGEDGGFGAQESTITLFSNLKLFDADFCSAPTYRKEHNFIRLLPAQIKKLGIPTGVAFIIPAGMAKDVAGQGFPTKQSVKKWIWDNTTESMAQFKERHWWNILYSRIRTGDFSTVDGQPSSLDLPDDTRIHLPKTPDDICIVVAGGPAELPVSMKVDTPPVTVSIAKWH